MNPTTPSTVTTARVLAFVQALVNTGCALFFAWGAVLTYQSGRVSDDAGGTSRYITVGFLVTTAIALVLLATATLTVASAVRLPRRRREARTVLIAAEGVSLLFIAANIVIFTPTAGSDLAVAGTYTALALAVIAALLSGPARRWVSTARPVA